MPNRSAWVTATGTTIESFEFAVFAYLAPILSPLFFPHQQPAFALLQTYVLMGVGFIARPAGALFFGHIGDRWGRKTALILSSLMIAMALVVTACLPTWQQVGAWAPVLLLLSRLLQGFSVGGEGSGTFVSLAEQGEDHHQRGSLVGFGFMLGSMGFGSAFLVIAGLTHALGHQVMADWGWRIPFVLGALLGIIFCLMRRFIHEGSAFKQVQSQGVLRLPVGQLAYYLWPLILVFLVAALVGTLFYIPAVIFMLDAPWYYGLLITLIFPLFSWFGGMLYDRHYGRRVFLLLGIMGLGLCPVLFAVAEQHHWYGIYLIITAVFFTMAVFMVGACVCVVPSQVRYTGFALAYNLGIIIGGFSPACYQWLRQLEHSPVMAFAILSTVCLGGLLALSCLPHITQRRD